MNERQEASRHRAPGLMNSHQDFCSEIIDSSGKKFADLKKDPNSADSRLIESAPDLLEALQGLMQSVAGFDVSLQKF